MTEARTHETLPRLLSEADYRLLKDNEKAVFYEPGVAAAGYAFAAILDRIRYGTLPAELAQETLRQQAASLAAALAAKPDEWNRFRNELQPTEDPAELVLAAVALGWQSKWT